MPIGRGDLIEDDVAADRAHGHGVGGVGDLDGFVEEVGDPLPRGGRTGDAAGVLGHVPQRFHRDLEVEEEEDEVARGHRPAQHLPPAEGEHECLRNADEDVRGTFESGGQAACPHPRFEGTFVAVGEVAGHGLLESVGLDDADGSERLGGGSDQTALALAGGAGGLRDLRCRHLRQQSVHRGGDEHDRAEHRVEDDHDDEEDGEGDDVADQGQARGDGDLLQPPDVTDESLRGVADRRLRVVAQRQGLNMVEHA